MPWELALVHPNGHRLGSSNEVKATLSKAWPQLQWKVVPSLLERIKDQPDHPYHALIPKWDAETRRRAGLPRTIGSLEGEGFSLEVFGIDENPVQDLDLEIRGSGDPISALFQIRTLAGWSIKELATGRFLDERQAKDRWTQFRD